MNLWFCAAHDLRVLLILLDGSNKDNMQVSKSWINQRPLGYLR